MDVISYAKWLKYIGYFLYVLTLLQIITWIGLGFWFTFTIPTQSDITINVAVDTTQIIVLGIIIEYVLKFIERRQRDPYFQHMRIMFVMVPTIMVVFFSQLFYCLSVTRNPETDDETVQKTIEVFSWIKVGILAAIFIWTILVSFIGIKQYYYFNHINIKEKKKKKMEMKEYGKNKGPFSSSFY
jgi:magnesium-transporting ATPase (P-type)